jgi:hypothetical protein
MDAGMLLEVAVDERSKREAAPRQLQDFNRRLRQPKHAMNITSTG